MAPRRRARRRAGDPDERSTAPRVGAQHVAGHRADGGAQSGGAPLLPGAGPPGRPAAPRALRAAPPWIAGHGRVSPAHRGRIDGFESLARGRSVSYNAAVVDAPWSGVSMNLDDWRSRIND